MNIAPLPADAGIIDEAALLQKLPVSRRTLHTWRESGVLPYIRPPGSRRVLYHWPTIEAKLLRSQQGV